MGVFLVVEGAISYAHFGSKNGAANIKSEYANKTTLLGTKRENPQTPYFTGKNGLFKPVYVIFGRVYYSE